jgi:hypothetical protein
VKEGDTVDSIARQFGDVAVLKALNNMTEAWSGRRRDHDTQPRLTLETLATLSLHREGGRHR